MDYKIIEQCTPCTSQSMDVIQSGEECVTATERLGLQWDSSWDLSGSFPGCFIVQDNSLPRYNKVLFNESPNPSHLTPGNLGSCDGAAICKTRPGTI